VVEIAGHAEGYSVGLGEVFGFKVEQGQWKHFPENDKLFQEAVQCLRDISQPHAPIVFSSCGAGSVEDYFPVKKLQGRKFYYPAPSIALLFSPKNGNLIFLSLMGWVCVTEWIQLQNPKKTRYFWGGCAAASFLVGLPIWWFEAGQPWCSPNTHGFTGHVVWHFLTALSVVFIAEYYSQFGFLSESVSH
jgi:hypothetical protein